MEIYHARDKIMLSRAIRGRRKYIEATFGSNDDINVSRSLIHVWQGKGKKDRYTLLSKPLVGKLMEYKAMYKPEQWPIEREAGITKRVYPHLFRHSFATHLIEQSTDLKIIKEFLGHNDIKTTEIYIHVAVTYKSQVNSPLDDILEGGI